MNTATEVDVFSVKRLEEVPASMRVRAFGVDYVRIVEPDGGELYMTRYGWPYAKNLLPAHWYTDGRYHKDGVHLTGGTGLVYRYRVTPPGEPRVELVVKISRFAEHVPLFMPSGPGGHLPPELADNARFNSPFEEFGLIEELRRGDYGPRDLRILTKRPYAIYVPPDHYPLWQLGRNNQRFSQYAKALTQDQERVHGEAAHVHLDIDRKYITLFGWVGGYNAEDAVLLREMTEDEMVALTARVQRELAAKGFRILDNKPKHFILRRRKNREWIKRNGEWVYVQIDFELMERTEEYKAHLKRRAALRPA